MQKAQGTAAKWKLKRSSSSRSGDAIKASAKDGQSDADILKEMKAKVDPRKAGLRRRPLLQVPWVRSRVPGLQQPRQEKRLLEVRRYGTLGQGL